MAEGGKGERLETVDARDTEGHGGKTKAVVGC